MKIPKIKGKENVSKFQLNKAIKLKEKHQKLNENF